MDYTNNEDKGCIRLGNPDLDFENLTPDFPIERTQNVTCFQMAARKQKNQKTRKIRLNTFRAKILDLYKSGFYKKHITRDLQQSTRIARKKIRHFQPGTV